MSAKHTEHAPPSESQMQSSKTIQIQAEREKGKQGTGQSAGSQYQDVSYKRFRITERSPDDPTGGLELVDLETALEHTLNLGIADPEYKSKEYAFAIFYNHTTLESVEILRASHDAWQVSTPYFIIDTNYRNAHVAHADSRRVTEMLGMFFEGTDWHTPLQFHYDSLIVEMNLEIERNGGEIPESWAQCPDGYDCPLCKK